jgi:hypothetical protein
VAVLAVLISLHHFPFLAALEQAYHVELPWAVQLPSGQVPAESRADTGFPAPRWRARLRSVGTRQIVPCALVLACSKQAPLERNPRGGAASKRAGRKSWSARARTRSRLSEVRLTPSRTR